MRGAEPLSEGNKVIIATGPLAGTLCPQGAKTSFHTKSPLTGGYADSNMGGMFAPEMRYAGYDVIILENRAEKPSILVIDDDKVELRDAKEHWGKGAIDTELALKKELGEEFQCAVIGPAGENLVKFACITHDFGRRSSRTQAHKGGLRSRHKGCPGCRHPRYGAHRKAYAQNLPQPQGLQDVAGLRHILLHTAIK